MEKKEPDQRSMESMRQFIQSVVDGQKLVTQDEANPMSNGKFDAKKVKKFVN